MTDQPMAVEARRQRNAGPLLSEREVARAVARTVELRLPPWLDEAARQQGVESLVPRPQAVVLRNSADDYSEGAYPAVVVNYRVTRMRQRSDAELEGELQIRVLAIVDDTDRDVAMRTAAIYEVAIQGCLVNTLAEYAGDTVRDIAPTQSGIDPREPSGATCEVLFTVTAGPMLSRNGYLAPLPDGEQPDPDDQGDHVPITSVELEVEPYPAGGSDGDPS